MEEFTLTLPSTVRTHRDNTAAHWKTRLSHAIKLPGQWVVGLKEISYPKSWYNMTNIAHILIHTVIEKSPGDFVTLDELVGSVQTEEVKDYQLIFQSRIIPEGYYPSVADLVDALNHGIVKCYHYHNREFLVNPPKIEYLPHADKMRLVAGQPNDTNTEWPLWKLFYFLEPFSTKIGFRHDQVWKKDAVYDQESRQMRWQYVKDSLYPFDVSGGIRNVYVTSNIVKHRLLGENHSQLLRMVETPPLSMPYGEQFHKHYDNPTYVPLNTNELEEIEILLEYRPEHKMPFRSGHSHVELHFKKIPAR